MARITLDGGKIDVGGLDTVGNGVDICGRFTSLLPPVKDLRRNSMGAGGDGSESGLAKYSRPSLIGSLLAHTW